MQIESLANKYRPRVLADLVGQDALVKAATGWFKRGIVPPAVLLAGNSGCGKTTTSRILARYVNCLNFNQKTLEPCGECRNCTTSSSPDVVEMNIGASRGIDEIRALIEQTKSMPMMGKTRVFTLDECFPADTVIEYAYGKFCTMQDVIEGRVSSVLSHNKMTGAVEKKPVTHRMEKGLRDMVRVWLDDGSYQDCTPNHPWWSSTRNRMVRADELQEGEDLLTLEEATAKGLVREV
jgi:DNA polymerase III delta prime subunit